MQFGNFGEGCTAETQPQPPYNPSPRRSQRYIQICLRVFKNEGEWVTDLQSLRLSGNLQQAAPPSYKQMNICKIHARNAAKKQRRQLTGTLTFLTTWGGRWEGNGKREAVSGKLLTGQSDRQKSLAKTDLQADSRSGSRRSQLEPESWRCLKMALKRTFAKVIVKMPSQIPWARQARQLKLNFYVTMTYSQSHSATVAQSHSPTVQQAAT